MQPSTHSRIREPYDAGGGRSWSRQVRRATENEQLEGGTPRSVGLVEVGRAIVDRSNCIYRKQTTYPIRNLPILPRRFLTISFTRDMMTETFLIGMTGYRFFFQK